MTARPPIAQFGDAIEVTQADRDAAAALTSGYRDPALNSLYITRGERDDHTLVQAFARHRTSTALPLAHPAAPQGEEGATKALETIGWGKVPRLISDESPKIPTADGQGRCAHRKPLYVDCSQCVAAYARAALAPTVPQEAWMNDPASLEGGEPDVAQGVDILDHLRVVLALRDNRAGECPDSLLDPEKDCPRCGANSNEGCRITVLADAAFVANVRAALAPAAIASGRGKGE